MSKTIVRDAAMVMSKHANVFITESIHTSDFLPLERLSFRVHGCGGLPEQSRRKRANVYHFLVRVALLPANIRRCSELVSFRKTEANKIRPFSPHANRGYAIANNDVALSTRNCHDQQTSQKAV